MTRIALLDDNPQDRFLARRALAAEFADLQATEIRDAEELADLLARLEVDAIVTDYQLRWTDGLEVLRAVRDAGSDVPVVMFTNTGDEELAATGLRTGLADYVVKSPAHYVRLAHAVRIALDKTAAVRREREARRREHEALRVAEEALRTKDEFLATLSHELRTPLNAIAGWVQMLRTDASPPRLTRALKVFERNTGVLIRLIEDLVDVSRIVTGHLALRVRPTDFRTVIDATLETLQPAVRARALHVTVDAPSSLPPVVADPDRLQQIVWNLLSNAVKFTPDGGVIRIGLRPQDHFVELTVLDTGPGLDPEFLPRAFDRFSQQDSSMTRAHGGLGLGLAIVRHLTEMHGGTVTASNAPGEGAMFTVTIPITATGTSAKRRPTRTPSVGRLVGLHVLVVDDDRDSRDVVAQILEDDAAVVTAVASGAEAYQILKRQAPDVLICDLSMPGEDGLAFIRRLRSDPDEIVARVPAIAVTAYVRPRDRAESHDAGYQRHLAKPVVAADLVAAVAHCHRSTLDGHEPV